MQGGRESRTRESVGQAVAPPSPPRHSTEVVRALPKRRGAASAIPPRALFLPDDSLPCINSANVRWVPALEQAPGTAGTSFSDLASIERVLVVCVMFYHRRGAAGPAWLPQGPVTGSRHGGYCYQGTNSCGVGLV